MAWSEMLNLLVLIFVKYIHVCCPDQMQEIYTIHFQPDATCIFWCINHVILSIVMLYNQSPMHSINNAPKYSIIRLHVLKSEI